MASRVLDDFRECSEPFIIIHTTSLPTNFAPVAHVRSEFTASAGRAARAHLAHAQFS